MSSRVVPVIPGMAVDTNPAPQSLALAGVPVDAATSAGKVARACVTVKCRMGIDMTLGGIGPKLGDRGHRPA